MKNKKTDKKINECDKSLPEGLNIERNLTGNDEICTEKRSRSMRSSQVVDDVDMFITSHEGRLTNYTMRFQGGSKLEFWVEE